jgi:hypothetical protein
MQNGRYYVVARRNLRRYPDIEPESLTRLVWDVIVRVGQHTAKRRFNRHECVGIVLIDRRYEMKPLSEQPSLNSAVRSGRLDCDLVITAVRETYDELAGGVCGTRGFDCDALIKDASRCAIRRHNLSEWVRPQVFR